MKYRVVPYLPRISSTDAPKDLASKIETFLNQNAGSNGRFNHMMEVPVMIKDEKTQETKIEKYAVWVFEDR
jgi:hypothetical protein